jgi:hypothetical protein
MNTLLPLTTAIEQLSFNHSVFAGYPLKGGPAILVVREYPEPKSTEIYFIEPNGVDDGVLTYILPVNPKSAPLPFPDLHQIGVKLYRTSDTKMAARLQHDYNQFYKAMRLRQLGGELPLGD